MNYSVKYSPAAMVDLDTVWDEVFEASKEPDIADEYVLGIVEKIAKKKLYPFSGVPLRYRGLFTGFYSVNYKKYKAFYRVRDNYIEVVRVIIAKRDYMKMLFDEDEDNKDDY